MVNCKKILYSGGKLHKTKTFHAICAILTNKSKRSLRLRLSHIDYRFCYTDSGGKAEEREREHEEAEGGGKMSLVWMEALLPLGIIAGMLCVMGNAQYYMHKAAHGRVRSSLRSISTSLSLSL